MLVRPPLAMYLTSSSLELDNSIIRYFRFSHCSYNSKYLRCSLYISISLSLISVKSLCSSCLHSLRDYSRCYLVSLISLSTCWFFLLFPHDIVISRRNTKSFQRFSIAYAVWGLSVYNSFMALWMVSFKTRINLLKNVVLKFFCGSASVSILLPISSIPPIGTLNSLATILSSTWVIMAIKSNSHSSIN